MIGRRTTGETAYQRPHLMEPAREQLLKMLQKPQESSSIDDVWQVFKRFSSQATEPRCEDDALLFQCGVFEFTGKPMFHYDFVRQFTLDPDYRAIEQLHCEFLFQPEPALQGLETWLWSYYADSREQFFQLVEGLRAFQAPTGLTPVRFNVYLECI